MAGILLSLMKREGLLDLNEAVQNPGKKLRFSVSTELVDEGDLDLLGPVTGELEAVSTGNALLLSGEFEAKCVLECARCGEPLEVSVSYEMDDDFAVEGIPSSYASDGYAEVVSDEPYPLFQKNGLLRDVYVRQGLLVSLPVQPLCEHGWDGPCPCAARRAEMARATAEGEEERGHPAMQALESYRREEQGGGGS